MTVEELRGHINYYNYSISYPAADWLEVLLKEMFNSVYKNKDYFGQYVDRTLIISP